MGITQGCRPWVGWVGPEPHGHTQYKKLGESGWVQLKKKYNWVGPSKRGKESGISGKHVAGKKIFKRRKGILESACIDPSVTVFTYNLLHKLKSGPSRRVGVCRRWCVLWSDFYGTTKVFWRSEPTALRCVRSITHERKRHPRDFVGSLVIHKKARSKLVGPIPVDHSSTGMGASQT